MSGGVIIAILIIIEIDQRLGLARKSNPREASRRRQIARAIGDYDRHPKMIAMHPIKCPAARAGSDRQRRIAANTIIATPHLAGGVYLRAQPDRLRLHVRGRDAIFAHHPAIAVIDILAHIGGRSRGDPFVESAIGIDQTRATRRLVAGQPAIAIIAGCDRRGRPRFAERVAAAIIGDRPGASGVDHRGKLVRAAVERVGRGRDRERVGWIGPLLDRRPVAVGVEVEILPADAARCQDALGEATNRIIIIGDAARRIDAVGDRRDIVVIVIAIGEQRQVRAARGVIEPLAGEPAVIAPALPA